MLGLGAGPSPFGFRLYPCLAERMQEPTSALLLLIYSFFRGSGDWAISIARFGAAALCALARCFACSLADILSLSASSGDSSDELESLAALGGEGLRSRSVFTTTERPAASIGAGGGGNRSPAGHIPFSSCGLPCCRMVRADTGGSSSSGDTSARVGLVSGLLLSGLGLRLSASSVGTGAAAPLWAGRSHPC